jgi:hypothetical protein
MAGLVKRGSDDLKAGSRVGQKWPETRNCPDGESGLTQEIADEHWDPGPLNSCFSGFLHFPGDPTSAG